MMQQLLFQTVPCCVQVPRWLWIVDYSSQYNANAQSLTQLFPWAAMDMWTLTGARALWVLAITSYFFSFLQRDFYFVQMIPTVSLSVLVGTTAFYVVLLTVFVNLLQSTSLIVQRMPDRMFVRHKPKDIESEFVWQPALREYKNASSKVCLYVLMCVTVVAVLGYAYDRGPSNHWIKQRLAFCKQQIVGDANSQPFVVDLVTTEMNFKHSISQPAINRAGFESKYSDFLGSYYKMFCYP
jgi:hypothetical protein